MEFSEIELPSNQKFGFFFTFIFAVVAAYFYYSAIVSWTYMFVATALLFLLITLIKSDALLPLNKLWMRFGLFLGLLISPIVIGFIFFGLITPYGIVMRIFGRNALNLKKIKKKSYWIIRPKLLTQTNFNQQF